MSTIVQELRNTKIKNGMYGSLFLTKTGKVYALYEIKVGREYETKIKEIVMDVKIVQIAYSFLPILLDDEGKIWIILVDRIENDKKFTSFGPIHVGCRIKTISELIAVGIDSSLWGIEFASYVSTNLSVDISFSTIFKDKTVKQIGCGGKFTIVICDDNSVWSKGKNYYGQLGISNFTDTSVFTQIGTNEKFVSVACGEFHSLLLSSEQQVFFCGKNKQLHLGLQGKDTCVPYRVEELYTMTLIACQNKKSLSVDVDGNLYVLGHKGVCTKENPIWFLDLPPIVNISSGLSYETIVQDINNEQWILRDGFTEFQKLEFPELCVEEQIIEEISNNIEYVRNFIFFLTFELDLINFSLGFNRNSNFRINKREYFFFKYN